MSGHFDTIVVGLGAVGSACLLQLARRGQRVLGLDRYDPPHAWGSSHGETRLTRCAVGEGEAYVPLVARSHEIWRELEQETGAELLTQCGVLILASASGAACVHGKGDFVRRTIAVAERFAIPHEELDAADVTRRFPQFRLRGDEIGYFEPGGGFIRPEACVEAQLTLARRHGAAIRTGTRVARIERDGGGVCVVTESGDRHYAAEALLAAGAWSAGLTGALAPYLSVTRQVFHWFEPSDPAAFAPGRFPAFIWMHGDGPEDNFYGFPVPPGEPGMKVGMEQTSATTPDPDRLAREVSAQETEALFRDHLHGRLPGLSPRAQRSAACLYTNTPDGDFLIARAPENERVLLVSACSGHGFKHSAGLGEAVARTLAADDTPDLAMFDAARFGALAQS
jgi:sarcosine oxidase